MNETIEVFSGAQAARLAGVSYRRFDYWRRRGYIPGLERNGPGSGERLRVTWGQVEVARRLERASRLIHDGIPAVADALPMTTSEGARVRELEDAAREILVWTAGLAGRVEQARERLRVALEGQRCP